MQTDFENRIKANLDASVNSIDADTRKQLADIRRQSLQANTSSLAPARWLTLSFLHQHWLAVTAMMVVFSLVAFMLLSPSASPTNHQDLALLEALNNAEDLEVMSDPDFYLWADEVLMEETHAL
ncbi:MAG TPA: hypothetical protein PL131_09390 [Methylotenera sp.]|nr:hypothetical protein [Methylotenera sp.]HPH06076.1 hypothetical protein [Methylotenera sp.]HPN00917.1 hypothetical protein [Methylotenera sp.]